MGGVAEFAIFFPVQKGKEITDHLLSLKDEGCLLGRNVQEVFFEMATPQMTMQ
jgi:hypothetical protein